MSEQPIIYTGEEDTGRKPVSSVDKWGPLGEIQAWTFHHSAGPRARTKAQACELHRAFQLDHMEQGWGDIGYHFGMDDHGRVYRLKPHKWKGTHTGDHNSRNIGFMVHGNYGHDLVLAAQRETLEWLFRGGFYELTGEPERGIAIVRGHQEWPGPTNRTACPGTHLMNVIRSLRNADFH